MRSYGLAGVTPKEVAKEVRGDAGCGLELVEISYGQSVWWSLAFEAFGPAREGSRILERTAKQFFSASAPPTKLTATRSFSYPAWLTSLPRAEQAARDAGL